MANSKASATIALLLCLNLLFLSVANADINAPKCRKNGLSLNVCANVLGLVNVCVNQRGPCCRLIRNLVALKADVCLCTLVKADILGLVNVRAPIQKLQLLLNQCGLKPRALKCK